MINLNNPSIVKMDPDLKPGTTGLILYDKSPEERSRDLFFSRDPKELVGDLIKTRLVNDQNSNSLGFTIIVGARVYNEKYDGFEEYLQINAISEESPAGRDKVLQPGDLLVRINGLCILGYCQEKIIQIFQNINPGDDVNLEICRGYPLPKIEIVTILDDPIVVHSTPKRNNECEKEHEENVRKRSSETPPKWCACC